MVFYLATCLLALGVGLFFGLQGLWLVLPFSGLEMLALGLGLHLTSRKVCRQEVIAFDRHRIRIEKGLRQIDQCWEFRTSWVRLIDEQTGSRNRRRQLALGAHGKYVEVGNFLDNSEKDALAFQLKDCIIRG